MSMVFEDMFAEATIREFRIVPEFRGHSLIST
jgi:hypothetical protein